MDPTFDQVDDRFGNDDPGIIYDAANETGTIEPGIVVTSGSQDGIVSTRDGSTLLNHGEILSASAKGVDFSGDHASVTNFVLARIIGATDGVSFDGPAGSLENHGTILGLTGDGVAFDEPTSAVALTNDGDIFGRDAGVLQISDHTGGRIDNAGSIRSHTDGIVIDTEDGFTTFITNAAGATIRGGVNAIHMELGGINLDNHGTLIGGIFDEANVRDVITNHGKIQGDVDLGGDDDLFNGTGGTAGFVDGGDGNDVLIGGSQADRLFGGDGNDRVNGAGGNDMLGGGAGLDTLTGGPGSDQFVFESILGGNNIDRITDFTPHVDRIDLEFGGVGPNGVLAASHFHVGAAAVHASDRIIYNPNNGFLFFDQDGTGRDPAIHFATLAPHLNLHNTDFFVHIIVS